MSICVERDYKPTGTNSGIHPRAKALMIVIAVITLIAVWLVPDEKPEKPAALPEMASPPEAEAPAAVPLPLPQADNEVEDNAKAAQREGDKARTFVAKLRAENSEPDAGALFTRAEQLQVEGQVADAYLLYRLAARQGDAQAALVLGTQADPAFYKSETSVLPGPDLRQAYKWYRAAAAAGSDEAETRLQQLREQAEQSAAAGDVSAQRLMLQWQ
jgi:TPR repeat protein